MAKQDRFPFSEQSALASHRLCFVDVKQKNTWSWLKHMLSGVLPSVNHINCSYIWLMGLERGHNVGDINLLWKAATRFVPAHHTGSPRPAGRGCWAMIYIDVLTFCCSSDFSNGTSYAPESQDKNDP